MSYSGTCAWCFDKYQSSGSRITQRHGWREANAKRGGGHGFLLAGGRRVGEYGNVIHSGSCPGTKYPPYELSTAGTEARLASEKKGLAGCIKTLEELATRPTFIETGKAGYDRDSWSRTIYAPYQVKVADGDDFKVSGTSYRFKREDDHYRYEKIHALHVLETECEKRDYEKAIAYCEKKIADWKLKEMTPFKPTAKTVHYRPEPGKGSGMRRYPTACGNRKSDTLDSTTVADETTCSRCINALAGRTKAKASKDEVAECAATIKAWLIGRVAPVAAKEIKKALPELDKRVVTRALNKLEDDGRFKHSPGDVSGTWDSPKKYWVIREDWRAEFKEYREE